MPRHVEFVCHVCRKEVSVPLTRDAKGGTRRLIQDKKLVWLCEQCVQTTDDKLPWIQVNIQQPHS